MLENENKLVPGRSATATTTVTDEKTALALGSGSLPVLATPIMVALMEEAACKALDLEEGRTSVGTYIAVGHTAASPIGATITAEATITAVDGRMIEFKVLAKDGAGEIGKGSHKRVVIKIERFMEKAKSRK